MTQRTKDRSQGSEGENQLADEYFEICKAHAHTLRTWLVAYGIGAPVLLVSKEAAWDQISRSPHTKLIGILFLAGVALQVVLTMLNKNVMWVCYRGAYDQEYRKRCWYKSADWVSNQYWIDIVVDLVTVGLFLLATHLAYSAIMAPAA